MAAGTSYWIDVSHPGLKKFRRVTGKDRFVVEQMARQQVEKWEAQWDREQDKEFQRTLRQEAADSREAQRSYVLSREAEALALTREAAARLSAAANILAATLAVNDAVDWQSLKRRDSFPAEMPAMPVTDWSLRNQKPRELPRAPNPAEAKFQPAITFLDMLVPSRRRKRESEANQRLADARNEWDQQCSLLRDADTKDIAAHDSAQQKWEEKIAAWRQEKIIFGAEQAAHNADIDATEIKYKAGDADAILDYCKLVLHRSDLPDFIPKNFEADYNSENRTLIVEQQLPAPSDLPTEIEWRYVKKTDEMVAKYMSASKAGEQYDSVIYQMMLRTMHEIFESDVINSIDSVVLNGWVDHLDQASGKNVIAFISSIQTTKAAFLNINLANVNPRECFRSLKGVSASRLSTVTPVAPIAKLNKEDARFVEARNVIMQEGTNLAAIPWDEFEHLVRQLFESEFAKSGGEVRVTQASRDGGVDAVIFDPDPIRGGKIIVQAKRYTNVVGVSAVRDLYGTVQHEGAIKGILVTTSNFGPDAYEFSKDKPITLLDGPSLLYLMGKNGYKARIDLQEAKRLANLP